MNFKELRMKSHEIKTRLFSKDGVITAEDVSTLRQYAEINPTAETIGAYSLAKRHVVEKAE